MPFSRAAASIGRRSRAASAEKHTRRTVRGPADGREGPATPRPGPTRQGKSPLVTTREKTERSLSLGASRPIARAAGGTKGDRRPAPSGTHILSFKPNEAVGKGSAAPPRGLLARFDWRLRLALARRSRECVALQVAQRVDEGDLAFGDLAGLLDDLGGYAGHDGAGGHVLDADGTGGDHGALAHANALEHNGVGAD